MPTFKDQKGYSRVNLLSRSAKDQRALSTASSNGGGSVVLKSNKTSLPIESRGGATTKLKRKTVVDVGQKDKVVGTKTVIDTPAMKMKVPGAAKVTSSFVPGDFQKSVVDRKTTPELGKELRENPVKTTARIKAQSAGQSAYKSPTSGKMEYSGRNQAKLSLDEPSTQTIPGKSHQQPIVQKEVTYDASVGPGEKANSGSGKLSGKRDYTLKFKDNGGAGKPQGSYYKTKARKKMMKGKGY